MTGRPVKAFKPVLLTAPFEDLLSFASRLIYAVMFCGAMCAIDARPLSAQNNITQNQVGDFVYFGGTYYGQPVSGNAQRIGDFVYYRLTVGGVQKNWTEQVIGQNRYGSSADGSSSRSQRIGGQTYTDTQPGGVTYRQQQIGNFIYITGSNGCSSTIQIIGTQRYTSGTC